MVSFRNWLGRGAGDVEFPFVKLEKLSGVGRWKITWRRDPSAAWSVSPSKFVSGGSQEVYDEAVELNARLQAEYDEKLRRRQAKEEQRREHSERDTGGHTEGPWWDCPVCNPGKKRGGR